MRDTKLVKCDVCDKSVDAEGCYELKVRKNDTGLTKIIDTCHACLQGKGVLDMIAAARWKKWKGGKWTEPE